jgi:hypothetical protein
MDRLVPTDVKPNRAHSAAATALEPAEVVTAPPVFPQTCTITDAAITNIRGCWLCRHPYG